MMDGDTGQRATRGLMVHRAELHNHILHPLCLVVDEGVGGLPDMLALQCGELSSGLYERGLVVGKDTESVGCAPNTEPPWKPAGWTAA